jgi:hypothetical protein
MFALRVKKNPYSVVFFALILVWYEMQHHKNSNSFGIDDGYQQKILDLMEAFVGCWRGGWGEVGVALSQPLQIKFKRQQF